MFYYSEITLSLLQNIQGVAKELEVCGERQWSHTHHRLEDAERQNIQDLLEESNRRLKNVEGELQGTKNLLKESNQRYQDAEAREQATKIHLESNIKHLVEAKKKKDDLITTIGHELVAKERELNDTSHRCADTEIQLKELQQTVCDANRRETDMSAQITALARELEGKTKELAAHNTKVWKIPANKVITGRRIGAGGWGEVLEGTLKIAIKKLHKEIAVPIHIEKMERETRLLTEVQHPNLVQFIGAIFDEQNQANRSSPLIITELLDINLRQAYEQNQLEPGNRLSIFIDIARALDYLHQRFEPIIHRDVSAPNVLLQQMPNHRWKGKVSDLGSANFLQQAQTMGEGAIIYSPPEVIPQTYDTDSDNDTEPPPQTVKIDVYSYGIVVAEVTASQFPDQREVFRKVQRDHPQLYQLVMHCKSRNPSDRPSMAEVLMELDKLTPF